MVCAFALTEVTLTADSEGRGVRCQFKSDKRSSSEAGRAQNWLVDFGQIIVVHQGLDFWSVEGIY